MTVVIAAAGSGAGAVVGSAAAVAAAVGDGGGRNGRDDGTGAGTVVSVRTTYVLALAVSSRMIKSCSCGVSDRFHASIVWRLSAIGGPLDPPTGTGAVPVLAAAALICRAELLQ